LNNNPGGFAMHPFKLLSLIVLAAFATWTLSVAHADNRVEKISAEDFTEEASAKGIAEIEVARLALEKSSREEVKKFAQTMITDHQKANEQLRELAERKDLDVSDDAELMNKAKAMVLKLRGEASFDKAYMNNQVVAHQQTIELFRRASESDDAQIAAFAKETLPKLQKHLQMAEQINSQLPDN
jgi:putative membrane protein